MVSEKKVKTPGPNGLIDMQVCCELCVLKLRYYSAHYEKNIAARVSDA